MRRGIVFGLALSLLLALSACRTLPEQRITTTPAPTEALCPTQTELELELDGKPVGFVYAFSDAFYVREDALFAAWPLTRSEETEILRLELNEQSFSLREGRGEAEAADGSRIALSAPVLHATDGWYLPVAALEVLWGRSLVRDTAGNVLRCLRVDDGPMLLFQGAEFGTARSCNDFPVLSAAALTSMSGGSAAASADADGTPTLTLRAWGKTLTLRQGCLRARLDEAELTLPAPAWQAGEDWYLPLSVAESLGCSATVNAAQGCVSLLKAEEGPACWFAGVGLGATQRVEEVLCVDAAALADAVGGVLEQQDDAFVLSAWEHTLCLHPNEARAELDGRAVTLPFPFVSKGEGWLVPLEPVAAALGLSAQTGAGTLVYSCVKPCQTRLYLDGRQLQAYTCPDGGLYVRLDEVNTLIGGSFSVTGNDALVQGPNGVLELRAGAALCTASGETLLLSAPTLADAEVWYGSAPELLSALGFSELEDPELDQRYYTRIVKNDQIPTGCRVPVLMYHAVSDYTWGIPELFVSPASLEEQLQALLDAGYTAITFEDLDRVDEIEKPVMLTFDDGYDDNYTELFPLLQKYKVKATVFVIVNDVGKNHKLTEAQIREMSDSGLVSIQSHTMSHEYLTTMYEKQLRYEHYDSMVALARMTGKQPFVMCYPTGKNAGYTRAITAEYYQFGLNMSGPCYVTGEAPYQIYRYYITRYTDVERFLANLSE